MLDRQTVFQIELRTAAYTVMGDNGLNFMRTYQAKKGPNKVRAQH